MPEKKKVGLGFGWSDEEKNKLKELYASAPRADILKALSGRSWDGIRRVAVNMGLSRLQKEKEKNAYEILVSDPAKLENFFVYMGGGKTLRDLQAKFDVKEEEVKKILESPPKGKKIARDLGSTPGLARFYCVPDLKQYSPKNRIWSYKLAENDKPAVAILFPDDLSWRRMRIVPLADFWFGHKLFDRSSMEEKIGWILSSPHVFCCFNGDGIYPRRIRKENEEDQGEWDRLDEEFTRLLAPIAHKMLWAQAGCFEDVMVERYYDSMKNFCEKFDIPYFRTPLSAEIHWAGNIFSFHCVHGKSASVEKGAKINAALKSSLKEDFHNYFVMSHIRDSITKKTIRRVEDIFDFDLKEREQHVLITPSCINYDESREAKRGQLIASRGQSNADLQRDGGYFTGMGSTKELEPFITKGGGQ